MQNNKSNKKYNENIVYLYGAQLFDTISFQYPIVFGFVHPRGPPLLRSYWDISCRLYILPCSFARSCKTMCSLLCMFYILQ